MSRISGWDVRGVSVGAVPTGEERLKSTQSSRSPTLGCSTRHAPHLPFETDVVIGSVEEFRAVQPARGSRPRRYDSYSSAPVARLFE
jgi:hypothetical protein